MSHSPDATHSDAIALPLSGNWEHGQYAITDANGKWINPVRLVQMYNEQAQRSEIATRLPVNVDGDVTNAASLSPCASASQEVSRVAQVEAAPIEDFPFRGEAANITNRLRIQCEAMIAATAPGEHPANAMAIQVMREAKLLIEDFCGAFSRALTPYSGPMGWEPLMRRIERGIGNNADAVGAYDELFRRLQKGSTPSAIAPRWIPIADKPTSDAFDGYYIGRDSKSGRPVGMTFQYPVDPDFYRRHMFDAVLLVSQDPR